VRVIRHLEGAAEPLRDVVLTLGNFDGVHLGHAAILARARAEATARRGRLVVLTFHPHPAAILAPDRVPPRVQSLHDRLACLAAAGVDVAVLRRFTRAFASLDAEAFVRDYLCRHLRLLHVVVGHRVSFGRGRAGSADTLAAVGAELGFTVESIGPVRAAGIDVSSTALRAALERGDMETTATLLGRPHAIRGRVVAGDRRGRTLGFPTANLHVPGGVLLPPDGVYAAWAATPHGRVGAALNIGIRPTFAGRRRTVEAHLLDFDGDLYGRWLVLDVVRRLRGEQRFDGPVALAAAIAGDVAAARVALGVPPVAR
jgi:riboflavin kinase/FMN adenylyltransferase